MFTLPNKLQSRSLAFFLVLFCAADLLIVRDIPWLFDNVAGVRFIVNYALSLIGLVSLIWLVSRFLMRSRLSKIAGFCLIFVPVIVQTSYFSIYKNFVTPFGVGFVAENPLMTLQLYVETLNPARIAAAVLASCFLFWILVQGKRPRTTWPAAVHAVLLAGILAHSVFGWYSVTLFQNSPIACYGTLIEGLARKTSTFKVQRPPVPAPKDTLVSAPNIIWVIGESTVLSHMGIYGYARNTTPGLSALAKEEKLVAFKNALSIGTKTRLSIPYLFTGLQGPDPHGVFYSYPTMFTYAKARGYATALFSAQDFKWGHLDKILIDKSVDTYADGSRYDPRVDVRKGADDLVVLEKAIVPFLHSCKPPFFLAVQMDGSHYPYAAHSPKEYKVFLPEESNNGINAFDNTIVYTDAFLTGLYREVSARYPNSWIFFTPDHGQNLGGKEGLFNDGYSENIVHNPLIIFMPHERYEALALQEQAPVSQIDIFATTLDLLGLAPLKPVDCRSLLSPVPGTRLRTCSEYMPTFHNNPTAIVMLPDRSRYYINFDRKSAVLPDGKTAVQYANLDSTIRTAAEKHLF